MNKNLTPIADEPNTSVLLKYGWVPGNESGLYCSAWRGHEEVLLRWSGDRWVRVAGSGEFPDTLT